METTMYDFQGLKINPYLEAICWKIALFFVGLETVN